MTEEKLITYTQAYEISTRVSADVDSKGNVKPGARVEITRKLPEKTEVHELHLLIEADIARGIEEVTDAIQEVLRRSA